MFYKQRELRRLWSLEIFNGDPNDPDDPDLSTRLETIVAWNAVDAIRHAGGKLAYQPVALFYVTWPEVGKNDIYKIESTAGPTGDPINPSIGVKIIEDKDWK